MLTYNGFSAWITSGALTLPEYSIVYEAESNRATCWIPCTPGEQFVVHWKDHESGTPTCTYITLDGNTVRGGFLNGTGASWRAGVRIGTDQEVPFTFQAVPEANTEAGATADESAGKVGTIVLRVKKVKLVGAKYSDTSQSRPKEVTGKRKAGDVRVAYGPERTCHTQHATTWKVEHPTRQGCKPETSVAFVFRYRTSEFLQAQDLIDATPTPTPTPSLGKKARKRWRVSDLPTPAPSSSQKSETSSPVAPTLGISKEEAEIIGLLSPLISGSIADYMQGSIAPPPERT